MKPETLQDSFSGPFSRQPLAFGCGARIQRLNAAELLNQSQFVHRGHVLRAFFDSVEDNCHFRFFLVAGLKLAVIIFPCDFVAHIIDHESNALII